MNINWLNGMDTLTGEATPSKMFCLNFIRVLLLKERLLSHEMESWTKRHD